MGTVVDFHSHILPGIDDGSPSAERSVELLKMEAEQGVDCVILTPHFYAHRDHLERFLQRREDAERLLRKETEGQPDLPEFHVAAEVAYFPGIGSCDDVSRLAFGPERSILIEMPPPPWTERTYRELEHLYERRGLRPIVAHIDRYIGRFRTFRIPQRLAQLPVLVQANGDFFLKRATAAMAMKLLRDGFIHLLGSDCHDLSSRSPNLGAAVGLIRRQLGDEAILQINRWEREIL